MFVIDVVLKSHRSIVKVSTLQTTYEAAVLQDLLLRLFFTSQVSKRVNDHTKDQVQHDDNHDKEKQQIVYNSSSKITVLGTI